MHACNKEENGYKKENKKQGTWPLMEKSCQCFYSFIVLSCAELEIRPHFT